MADSKKPFTVYLTDQEKDDLEEDARSQRRSLSAQLVQGYFEGRKVEVREHDLPGRSEDS